MFWIDPFLMVLLGFTIFIEFKQSLLLNYLRKTLNHEGVYDGSGIYSKLIKRITAFHMTNIILIVIIIFLSVFFYKPFITEFIPIQKPGNIIADIFIFFLISSFTIKILKTINKKKLKWIEKMNI